MGGLFLAALALRLAHLATIRNSPFFQYLGLDPLAYDTWGWRIAQGDWLGSRVFYQDPLYPYFLGLVYAIWGHVHLGVLALQMLLGAATVPLIYHPTRQWLGRGEAALAGLLAAIYLPSLYYEGLILKSWMGAVLVAAALFALSRSLLRGGGAWMATGFLLGLAALVRGNILLFIPVLAAWVLFTLPTPPSTGPGRSGPRGLHVPSPRAWRSVAGLLLGVMLVLGPTALRNRLVGGEWVLTTSQGGQNFYIGNNPTNRDGRYDPLPFVGANPKYEEKGFANEASRRAGHPLRPTEVSRFWFREASRWIATHPADWARLMWLKLRNYWGAYEVPDNLDYYLYREHAPVLRLPLPGFGLLAPLGLLGMGLAWRRRGWPRALTLFILVYSASVILFFVFSRYRIAMLPALFPFAGLALMEIYRRTRKPYERRTGGLALLSALLAVVLLLAFVNLPVAAPASHWTYRLASRLGLPTRLETSSTAHYNLALAYARQAKEVEAPEPLLEMALAEFREAVRQDPDFPHPYAEMAKVLTRLHRDREAIEAYQTVVSLAPQQARPFHAMGLLYLRMGDLPQAEAAFRRALALDPERIESLNRLGAVLLEEGRPDLAGTVFRRVLEKAPGNPSASEGLRRSQAGS